MGSVYAEKVFGIERPRVALLSIGEEKGKGNKLTHAAYDLLEATSLNFVGNIESRHLFSNAADVIVADGFAGTSRSRPRRGWPSTSASWSRKTCTGIRRQWLS